MGGAPSKPDPSRTVEVIGAGYSKTGTLSMQLALETLLHGPVMHGGTHLLKREDAFNKAVYAAYQAREAGDRQTTLKLLRQITTGFAGLVDAPFFDFLPELCELYPDAKVVLVTRDPAKWWASMGGNLDYALPWYVSVLTAPMPGLRWMPGIMAIWLRGCARIMQEANGPGTVMGPDLLELHNEMVRKLVPAERLLVMKLGDGWEPLCEFLEKPVPREGFPQANEREAAAQEGKKIFAKCSLVWTILLSVAGTSLYTNVKFLRR